MTATSASPTLTTSSNDSSRAPLTKADYAALLALIRSEVRELVWVERLGLGVFAGRIGQGVYDDAYYKKYLSYSTTEQGRILIEERWALVSQFHPHGMVLDYGVGCGAFVAAADRCMGFDINPAAEQALKKMGRYMPLLAPDLTCWSTLPIGNAKVEAVCFWDVLEHIADLALALTIATKWVFLSIPIFRDAAHALASKHYRPDEHYWYFTRDGLVRLMAALGWELAFADDQTEFGREDVYRFAFRRVGAA